MQAKRELLKLGIFWEHCVGNVGIPSLLPGQSADGFNVVSNLSLLPKFHDKQPETFFILFEYIADAGVCLDFDASVCIDEQKHNRHTVFFVACFLDYEAMKSAVLKA